MPARLAFFMLIALLGVSVLAGCQTQGSSQSENGNANEAPQDEEPKADGDAYKDGADEDTGEDNEKPDRTVDIDLSEFSFDPENVTVKAGEKVRFNVENSGAAFHTYSIAGNGESRLDVGEKDELDVTFDEPGTYEVRCTVPGHVDRGMIGEITVE